jgi:hypothetical protein
VLLLVELLLHSLHQLHPALLARQQLLQQQQQRRQRSAGCCSSMEAC